MFTFYNEMPSLARQQIAELFLVLLMLLAIDKTVNVTKKGMFSVIFAFSLVTSHYGLSYIFMLSLVAVWVIFILRKWQLSRKGMMNSPAFVFLYWVFALAWYIYVSGSSTFAYGLGIGRNIMTNIFEFANPTTVEGLNIITRQATSPLYEIAKILYLIANFLISAGMLALLLKRTKMKFEREYTWFSAVNFALLLGGLTVPYLASSLGTTRLYQVALLFLAPFCVVGGRIVWDTLNRVLGTSWNKKIDFLKVLSMFFAVFFLFSSGFVYEIAKDRPSSISLNSGADFPHFNEQEVVAANWLKERANKSTPLYSDLYRKVLLEGTLGYASYLRGYYLEEYPEINVQMLPHAYLFLGYTNVRNEEIVLLTSAQRIVVDLQNLTLYDTLSESDRLYDNNGANIYLLRGD